MPTSEDPVTVTNYIIDIQILGYQIKVGKLVESYDDITDLLTNLEIKE